MTDDPTDESSARLAAGSPPGDYYDPHPRLVLDRPILLAGQIGCGAGAMARNVCGRTGLSFVEVDRFLEHRAGRSLARMATEEGYARLEEWTTAGLLQLMGQRPAGFIVLGNAWPRQDDETLNAIRESSHLVRIERAAAFLFARLETEVARHGDWIVSKWPSWGRPVGEGIAESMAANSRDHRRFLDLRRPLLESAQTLLDAGEQHENTVAEILMAALERVLEADRI